MATPEILTAIENANAALATAAEKPGSRAAKMDGGLVQAHLLVNFVTFGNIGQCYFVAVAIYGDRACDAVPPGPGDRT